MKKPVNLILVFVAVAAWIVATVAYKRLLAAEKTQHDAAAAVLKRNEAMKAEIDALKPSLPQLAVTGTDGADGDAEAAAKHAAKIKAEKERFAKWEKEYEANKKKQAERMKNDPEFALKHYAALRAESETKHAPFCRLQNLSKEQGDALAEAEFQWHLRMDDLQTALTLKERGVDIKAQRKAASDEFAANVKAALGDDLYQQFQTYKRQDAAWTCVNAYGADMSVGDIPLSAEQAAQLVDAIANACPQYQKGKWVDMTTVDWDAVDAAAVDFLTPEQLDFFKNSATYVKSPSATVAPPRQSLRMSNALRKLMK